jgi:hypothetical protein
MGETMVKIVLKNGLKYDLSESDYKLIEFLNHETKDHLEKIKNDFKIPDVLKYNPKKENKPITEEKIIFEDEGGTDIFTDIIGIVSSPERTNSVELKRETYDRS